MKGQWFCYIYGILFIADDPDAVASMVIAYERTIPDTPARSVVIQPCAMA